MYMQLFVSYYLIVVQLVALVILGLVMVLWVFFFFCCGLNMSTMRRKLSSYEELSPLIAIVVMISDWKL